MYGITQTQIAKICGVSQAFISMVFSGKKKFPLKRKLMLMSALFPEEKWKDSPLRKIDTYLL